MLTPKHKCCYESVKMLSNPTSRSPHDLYRGNRGRYTTILYPTKPYYTC